MLSIDSKPSSAEEGIMINLEKCMNETQPVIIDGKEWYHKRSVIEAYPRSMPATYTHLRRVNDFLCTKLVGNAAYIRFDETIDWRMELMAAMHNQIESYASLNGDVFAEYDGIVNDIQKQLKEQARINSRLQRAFKRIGDA